MNLVDRLYRWWLPWRLSWGRMLSSEFETFHTKEAALRWYEKYRPVPCEFHKVMLRNDDTGESFWIRPGDWKYWTSKE